MPSPSSALVQLPTHPYYGQSGALEFFIKAFDLPIRSAHSTSQLSLVWEGGVLENAWEIMTHLQHMHGIFSLSLPFTDDDDM